MPLITIDGSGNSLQYVDTGAPQPITPDTAYTTLIIVHGTAFHGGEFLQKLSSDVAWLLT